MRVCHIDCKKDLSHGFTLANKTEELILRVLGSAHPAGNHVVLHDPIKWANPVCAFLLSAGRTEAGSSALVLLFHPYHQENPTFLQKCQKRSQRYLHVFVF